MSLYEHGFDEASDQGTDGTNGSAENYGDSSMNAGSTGNGNANTAYTGSENTNNTYSGNGNAYGAYTGNENANNAYTGSETNSGNAYATGTNGVPFSGTDNNTSKKKTRRFMRKPKCAKKVKGSGTKHPMGRKFGTAIALGLVFGVVAGAAFGGTTYISNRAKGGSGTTATLTKGNGKISSTSTSSATTVTDVSDIVNNVMPSIVQVTNISVSEYQSIFGTYQPKESESAGSGIIISQDDNYLYIATNNHVVSNATSLTITFNDNQAVSGEVQGTDSSSDLAVIKVKMSDIPSSTQSAIKVATIGSSDDLSVGESAVVIGNALGYGQSVTTGVISALNREVSIQDDNGNTITNKLIQTDAAVNPGNSGGALLNMNGEVVGIVSAKYSDTSVEGMGYAIPISSASTIIQKLMKGESVDNSSSSASTASGYSEKTATVTLGSDSNLQIYCMDITSDMASQYGIPEGVYVRQIITNGAADKAGIQEGDVITKVGDKSVTTTQELKSILAEKKAGAKVEITYQRKSQKSGSSSESGNSGSGNSSSGSSGFGFFNN